MSTDTGRSTTTYFEAYFDREQQRLKVTEEVFYDEDVDNLNFDAKPVSQKEIASITKEADGYVGRVAGLLEPMRDADRDRIIERTMQALEGVQDRPYDSLRRNLGRVLP